MSLSWFFSSKKKTHATEPPGYTAESQGDDYVFVEKRENPQGDSGYVGPCPNSALPYSPVPDPRTVEQTSSMNISQNQNFLYGVPFKLSTDTVLLKHDSVNRNRIHANQVLSHISQLNFKSFEYDFLVEKSVVLEAGGRDIG
jgi:hypothetical protein